MSEFDETDEQSEEQPNGVLPWIPAFEAFTRYKVSLPKLKEYVKSKKVRKKTINGKEFYSVEDLEKVSTSDEAGTPEMSAAELLRAARDMMETVLKHDREKHDKYQTDFSQLLKTQSDHIDKQNSHILALEKAQLEMREAAEKVFNLEHQRKLEELREQRREGMQKQAMEMVQKTLGPWVMQKLGGQISGAASSAAEGGPDPRLAQLGKATVEMVCSMTDENFIKLRDVIPAEEYMVLSAIRESMKGGQS